MESNPNQNSYNILYQNRKKNPKISVESHKNPNNEGNPNQKDECWRN